MATTTKKIKCNCEHAFQDLLYGKGMRLATLDKKGENPRCTVCTVKWYGGKPNNYKFSCRTLKLVGQAPGSWASAPKPLS